VAVNPEGSFFDFAVTDVALTHALLSMVSLHFDLRYPHDVGPGSLSNAYQQAIYHQVQAVSNINQRLSVSGMLPDDAMVGAVGLLALFAVSLRISVVLAFDS
jgi:hypothetical protein